MGKNGKERKKRRLAQSFQAIAGTRDADSGSESDSETDVRACVANLDPDMIRRASS